MVDYLFIAYKFVYLAVALMFEYHLNSFYNNIHIAEQGTVKTLLFCFCRSVSRKAKYGRNSENCAYVEDDWEL